jgi:histidinol-phosphate aminotransferase
MTANMTDWRQLIREPLRDLGPYVPGSSAAEVKARYGIEDLARLNWNEGLFGPLPGVLEATARRLDEVWTYPEEAYEELRDAVAGWLGIGREHVLPGHGIQALVMTVVSAFVHPGDRVVVPRPTYGLYAPACQAAGAVVHRVDCPDLRLDLERIAAAAHETGARLAWICDPNNPTGARLEPAEWAAFLDQLPPDCIAVADEAYVDYIRPEERTPRLADVAEGRRVIVLRTFSKVFALAGLRLGYAVVDAALTPYLHSVQEPFNVNLAALAAGAAALERPENVDARREETNACRDLLVERLVAAGLKPMPSDANFVLVDLGLEDDLAVADLVARRGILVRPGTEFGLPGYARITVAPAPLMERVSGELADACREVADQQQAAA